MSNILIIKHGSLGDIAQACGAIQDICESHQSDKVYIMTTNPYVDLFEKCPFLTGVLLDKRLSKFNLIYLYSLMRKIKKFNFIKVYDLQNSSRTSFYKKILFPNSSYSKWSSSLTTLPEDQTKKKFDEKPVLERFNYQLKTSGIQTKHTLIPDFSWSCCDISEIFTEYNLQKYIILFPFCSPHLQVKKWPYYDEFIKIFKKKFNNYDVLVAPGPNEIVDATKINAISILDKGKALNISQLSSLIKKSSFIIANDTGPAHISAHLNARGVALFGSHTTAKKVSIETNNFKAIQVGDLSKLSPEKVLSKILL